MQLAIFNTKPYEREIFLEYNKQFQLDLEFIEARLVPHTASLCRGHDAICAFVNDDLSRDVLEVLAAEQVQLIALRSAGFNHVDLDAAKELGLTVARVPAYSPYAVAEHTVGLMMTLNRKFHRSYQRVREGNFALHGLLGFDMHGRTAGIIGTGKIGSIVAKILCGFGLSIVAYDANESEECKALGVRYVDLPELLAQSDIVSLHCPLNRSTHHIIDAEAITRMKPGVMLVNTSRGGLVDTAAVIEGLKRGHLGFLGLDVYEEEEELFFEDLSNSIIQDDRFMRLLTFPNVMITAHQAFFTKEAVSNIVETTLYNVKEFISSGSCSNEVKTD